LAELDAAHEAYVLLREAPETKWRLEALNAYAMALLHNDQTEQAETIAREGLDLARDSHDFVYQASFLRRLASFLTGSDPREAEVMYDESISLCRVLENDFGLALSHHGMSHLYFRLGRFDEAVAAARIAADVRREINDRRGLVNVLADVAQFSLALGRTDGVAEALSEALEIVRRTENTLGARRERTGDGCAADGLRRLRLRLVRHPARNRHEELARYTFREAARSAERRTARRVARRRRTPGFARRRRTRRAPGGNRRPVNG
jgi:tetratricopeptide (TPR) repeat protein